MAFQNKSGTPLPTNHGREKAQTGKGFHPVNQNVPTAISVNNDGSHLTGEDVVPHGACKRPLSN